MDLGLTPEFAKRLSRGMSTGDRVELPFPVIYLWAMNGQASYKSVGGALFYGGWACKEEDANAVFDTTGSPLPGDWEGVEIATRDGGNYSAYTTRQLYLAPFGRRESWLDKEGKRHSHYVDGARNHTQVLAYLAERKLDGKTWNIVPWGPVVLTAKGYQAKNLTEAFKAWERATAKVRGRNPGHLFYTAYGTFGDNRVTFNVGKVGAQSPITPIVAYIPPDEKITEALLTKLYVGGDVVAVIDGFLDDASEWLNAWKPGSNQGENGGEVVSEGAWPEEGGDFVF